MLPRDWIVRILFGISGTVIGLAIYQLFPNLFLPMSNTIDYFDSMANPNLIEVINDNRSAVFFMGIYLGLLAYEIYRRDWNNVKLNSRQVLELIEGPGFQTQLQFTSVK